MLPGQTSSRPLYLTVTVQVTYDPANNRTSLTNPGGITTNYTHDAANRLAQMTQGGLVWTFAYDGAGNRTLLTHPNGTSTVYTYLRNNWLEALTHRTPGGATFQQITYTYERTGTAGRTRTGVGRRPSAMTTSTG